ncbi:MAG: hypothetical protein ACJ8C4_06255 [Gemmataceae bacterium]
MSIKLESQSGVTLENPTPAEIERVLDGLDGVDESYASLTQRDGSYIQVGGGPSEFTVELRKIGTSGSFCHLKAYRNDMDLIGDTVLIIGGVPVNIKTNQKLNLSMVKRLFTSFTTFKEFDRGISWLDISQMFVE